MGKLSRSVRRKTIPVETGAGRMRIWTGTPLCSPTPLVSTGRCSVISKRKIRLQRGCSPHSTSGTQPQSFDVQRLGWVAVWLKRYGFECRCCGNAAVRGEIRGEEGEKKPNPHRHECLCHSV